MDILFKNANVVDKNSTFTGDVYIKNGIINQIGNFSHFVENTDIHIIDATGLTLMPSFADLHAHFRTPGYEYKETLETGSKSAVAGGYTFVNLMANTKPICSDMDTFNFVIGNIEKIGLINAHQCISVTKDFDGKTLSHLDSIDTKKVRFISDDGKGVISNITSYNSMLFAKENDITIMTHAEDMDLTPIDYRISENIITFRDIYLSSVTGAHVHFSHVSTKEAIEEIRRAKKNNVNITCEIAPHHIALYDNDFRVNPPIRTKEDTIAIIEAIIDGTVDAIATDHAPHTIEDKKLGSPGLPGLESAFSVCYTSLVKNNTISLNKLSTLLSKNPYEIIGKGYDNRGLVQTGFVADLALVDLNKKYTIKGNDFYSMGKITPFEDKEVYGKVLLTMKNGKIVYDDRK